MTMDPGDYDPRELRDVGFESSDRGSPAEVVGPAGVGASETAWSGQRRTLQLIEDTLEHLSAPYLTALPDTYRGELLVLEWLELLVTTAGRGEAIEGLAYYASVYWITDDVESELREYLRGVDARPEEHRSLDQDDHATSLVYIARLASMS
jgi:archaellum component FlaD/FlaE